MGLRQLLWYAEEKTERKPVQCFWSRRPMKKS